VTTDREKLVAKRLKLQLKNKAKERISSAAYILEKLDEQRVSYEFMMDLNTAEDDKEVVDWPFLNFPDTGWGQIDWDKVVSKSVCKEPDIDAKKAFIDKSFKLEAHEKVYVSWANAFSPTISIDYNDCLKMLFEILEEDFDCWIYSIEHKLIVESYHEGDLTFGKV